MDNSFSFFALGEEFDVDAFLASSSMVPSRIWRRGEPKRYSCIGSPYPNSGLTYEVADGHSVPFLQQEGLAISFLKAYRDELKALGQFPGVSRFTLGLHYSTEARRNLVGFSIGASPLLMWHLLDVGCSLTNYVWLQHDDPENEA